MLLSSVPVNQPCCVPLQDERIQMAFNSRKTAPVSLTGSQHGAGSSQPSPNLSTGFRRPDTPPETPDLGVTRKDAHSVDLSSAMSTLTKNLDSMAFGSPT